MFRSLMFWRRDPVTGRRRWIGKLLLCLSVLLVLLTLLTVSSSPSAPQIPPPTTLEVGAAKDVYARIKQARMTAGGQIVTANWQELQSVIELGGRAAGFEHAQLQHVGGQALISASLPLGLGLWLNGRLSAEADERHRLRLHGRIGELPIPAFIVHGGIALARQVLRLRGAEFPPLDSIVSDFRHDETGLSARIDMPNKSRVMSALSGLRSEGIDPALVEAHYCRLMQQQAQQPSKEFVEHVRRAFTASDGSVIANRSAFVALALLAAGMDVGALSDGSGAMFSRCGKPPGGLLLLGRDDLPKHWAVSAALTSAFSNQASLSVGTWKEISDSGVGGSGFSLVDLAADRSGAFSAERASDTNRAREVRQWLARAMESDLLPVGALALAEGMSEAEFQSRFTSTESATFAATVARIDQTLAVRNRF
jgi:hypothetical protein